MKPERKSIVVLADTNPIDVTLSREVRTVNKMSLVYFKLQGFDTAQPPYNLWIRVEGVSTLSSDVLVNSSIPNQTPGSYKVKDNSTAPLFTKLAEPYVNAGNAVQYQVLHGIQPKGMRWSLENISNITNFKVTILDDSNNPLPLVLNAKIELVFEAEWLPSQLQSPLWRTDHVYMNSMNG